MFCLATFGTMAISCVNRDGVQTPNGVANTIIAISSEFKAALISEFATDANDLESYQEFTTEFLEKAGWTVEARSETPSADRALTLNAHRSGMSMNICFNVEGDSSAIIVVIASIDEPNLGGCVAIAGSKNSDSTFHWRMFPYQRLDL